MKAMCKTVGADVVLQVMHDAQPISTSKNVPRASPNNETRKSIRDTSSRPTKSLAPEIIKINNSNRY